MKTKIFKSGDLIVYKNSIMFWAGLIIQADATLTDKSKQRLLVLWEDGALEKIDNSSLMHLESHNYFTHCNL